MSQCCLDDTSVEFAERLSSPPEEGASDLQLPVKVEEGAAIADQQLRVCIAVVMISS